MFKSGHCESKSKSAPPAAARKKTLAAAAAAAAAAPVHFPLAAQQKAAFHSASDCAEHSGRAPKNHIAIYRARSLNVASPVLKSLYRMEAVLLTLARKTLWIVLVNLESKLDSSSEPS